MHLRHLTLLILAKTTTTLATTRRVPYTKDCGEGNGKSIDLSFMYGGDTVYYDNQCGEIKEVVYYSDDKPFGEFAFDADAGTESYTVVELGGDEGGITGVEAGEEKKRENGDWVRLSL